MARAIWKGNISFGLVNIPVGLFSAESPQELSFRQLDKRNLAPVGYRKYNKESGEEVSGEDIVKGYEYEEDRYVLISDEDFRRANPEKTQTVEITDFVDLDEIDPVYFDKPYYLAPLKKTTKAYALLREAMKRSGKVGIAKVVIRSREYLAAVVPQGDVLVLEILRFPYEIRGTGELEVPRGDAGELGISDRELEMAETLIGSMAGGWEPEKYHDSYRDDLMALIQRRVESGQTEVIDETPVEEPEARTDVIDIMSLLKRSVEATARERGMKAADTARGRGDDEDDAEDEAPARPAAKSRAPAKASPAPKAVPAPKPAAPAKPAPAAKPVPAPAAKPSPAASKPASGGAAPTGKPKPSISIKPKSKSRKSA
jgi:DNA end-binding protein Ku